MHFAFTTPSFGDASVVIVSDYHPASETVGEKYFSKPYPRPGRTLEDVMWSFIVQIASALKTVHSSNLAVRMMDKTKVLLTDENRIRLSGCAIQDVLDPKSHEMADLQRQDLQKFGKLAIDIAHNLASNYGTKGRGPDFISRTYSERLVKVFNWLSGHGQADQNAPVEELLKMMSNDVIEVFDASLKADDVLQVSLNRELENSRIVRLMTKLNCLTERPEYEQNRSWTSQGSRAVLPLFRDYVFHQVDAQNSPVIDMGHILACLNKLDVGVEEKITLTTRDEQTIIVVTYKELKQAVESAWADLMRRASS